MKYGTLANLVYATGASLEPKIGDGATLLRWSDRQAYTVVEVKNNYVVVTRDTNVAGAGSTRQKAYRRKDGQFYLHGHLLKIGFRDEYYDPTF